MRSRAFLLIAGLMSQAAAASMDVRPAVQGISQARREIVALLPSLQRQDLAAALKAAAKRGTKVTLIAARSRVRGGGYLLNVSHGPPSIETYLFGGAIPQPWVMVDGAWVISGTALNSEGAGMVELSQNPAVLSNLRKWSAAVTKGGPTDRVNILRLFYGAPEKRLNASKSPQLPSGSKP